MPFVPPVARPYLSTAAVADPLGPNDTLAPLRREALDVLGRAYAAPSRLIAGGAAWLLGVGAVVLGATALSQWRAGGDPAVVTGLAGGAVVTAAAAVALGVVVVRAGSLLSRAIAAWLATPTRAGTTDDRPGVSRARLLGLAGLAVVAGCLGLAAVLAWGPEGAPTEAVSGSAGAGTSVTGAAGWSGERLGVPLLVLLGALTGAAALCLLSGANRIRTAAWEPATNDFGLLDGDASAGNGQTAVMLLVPSPARDYLDPAEYRRDWTTYGSMTIRRQSALRTLLPAYTDLARLALGALCWVLCLAGAVVLRAGFGAESSLDMTAVTAFMVAAVLLAAGIGGGVVVLRAGARLVRGAALWALMPQLVDATGQRRAPDSGVPAEQRGGGEPVGSLTPRLLAALVAAGAGVYWAVGLVGDLVEATAAYATSTEYGAVLASVIGTAACGTAAVASARGWQRVRSALTGHPSNKQVTDLLREVNGSGHGRSGAADRPADGDPAGTWHDAQQWQSAHAWRGEPTVQGEQSFQGEQARQGDQSWHGDQSWQGGQSWHGDQAWQGDQSWHGSPPWDGGPARQPHAAQSGPWSAEPAQAAGQDHPGYDHAGYDQLGYAHAGFDQGGDAHADHVQAAGAAPLPHRSEVPQVRVDGHLLAPGTTLIGRSPAPRAGERVDHTLALEDRTLSKTHLTVHLDAHGAQVIDRSSTNGTVLVTGSGERRLVPWQATVAPPGARVRAGATELTVSAHQPEPAAGAEPDAEDLDSTVMRPRPHEAERDDADHAR